MQFKAGKVYRRIVLDAEFLKNMQIRKEKNKPGQKPG